MRPPLLLVPALILAVPLASCRKDSAETRIRRSLGKALDAVQDQDPKPLLELLAPTFRGPEGMDRPAAKLFLMATLRTRKPGITILSDRIEVQGGQATQNLQVLLTGRDAGALLPDDGSRKTLIIRWEEMDGEWKVVEVVNSGD